MLKNYTKIHFRNKMKPKKYINVDFLKWKGNNDLYMEYIYTHIIINPVELNHVQHDVYHRSW